MSIGRFNRWERTNGTVVQTVVQIQRALYTGFNTVTINTGWTDVPGLSVAITPTNITSKIRIDVRWMGEVGSAWDVVFGVRRNGTLINQPDADGGRALGLFLPVQTYVADDNNSTPELASFFTLDTPGTTSSVSYTLAATSINTTTLYTGRVMSTNTGYNYEKISCEIMATEYLS